MGDIGGSNFGFCFEFCGVIKFEFLLERILNLKGGCFESERERTYVLNHKRNKRAQK